ncbi:molecular chaperone [Vibrio sp. 99-70-13A1]|uniref:TorD/DmsD family molecular chaperone n=1 Tax=Vibrio sp. 99-70-13A1 TaxID=2607601 RepID=UPI0014934229|nr:molecular chaperone [Vibrio sp. 99-70-13A1]NOH99236.1 molecular chaperone [Vibrio sp. 99-70-13A1]
MIIDTHKLLGSLFYRMEGKPKTQDIVQGLVDNNVLSNECLLALKSEDEISLTAEFSRLFEGVGDMPAPPWGSVYLDRERVVFGDSTVQYRQFLMANGFELDSGLREPEDQFGLMLLAHAFLLENENIPSANVLLEKHLLTWSFYYLDLLEKETNSEYYKLLSKDIIHWFNELIDEFDLNPEKKEIYIKQ